MLTAAQDDIAICFDTEPVALFELCFPQRHIKPMKQTFVLDGACVAVDIPWQYNAGHVAGAVR